MRSGVDECVLRSPLLMLHYTAGCLLVHRSTAVRGCGLCVLCVMCFAVRNTLRPATPQGQ